MKLGFISTLTLIFIALKLTGIISWSWWLVLMPMLLPAVILLGLFVIWFSAVVVGAGR